MFIRSRRFKPKIWGFAAGMASSLLAALLSPNHAAARLWLFRRKMQDHASHKTRMLWVSGVLHAFTHLYQVALIPLYLLIQKDFKLQSISQATLLLTVMMIGYFVPSYPMGFLADHANRKKLLGFGLAINSLG